MEKKIETTSKLTTIHAELCLLSIAIGSNFGYEKFLIRRTDDNSGVKDLVEKFVTEIEALVENETKFLPKDLVAAINFVKDIDVTSGFIIKTFPVSCHFY